MSRPANAKLLTIGLCTLLTVGCGKGSEAEGAPANSAGTVAAATTLRDAFKDHFLMGVAVNQSQFTGRDSSGAALVKAQFNAISPENVLKWEVVHPRPGEYNFDPADAYV
jgi:endo-1,4-beta-xylanase